MLPARYRMRRSAEFDATVKTGRRIVQPDLVIHIRQTDDDSGPRLGLIIAKSVGSAVQRHLVARRLRHVARTVLTELDPAEQVVIRALPSSRNTISALLEQQLRSGLSRAHHMAGRAR